METHGTPSQQDAWEHRRRTLLPAAARAARWGPAIAYMIGNWLVSGTPGDRIGPLPAPDWLLHGLAYFVFGLLLHFATGHKRLARVMAMAILASYAAVDEWHQSWVPGRTATLPDWLADVAGGGLALSLTGLRKGRARKALLSGGLLLALAALVASPAPGQPEAVQDGDASWVAAHRLLGEAESALAAGDLKLAEQTLARAAVPESERSYRAFRRLMLQARIALAQGRPGDAVQPARSALELAVEDDRLDAQMVLAEALAASGSNAEALDALASAAEGTVILYRGDLRHDVLTRMAGLAGTITLEAPEARTRLLRYGRVLARFGRWQEGATLFSRPGWQEQEAAAASELARALGALGQRIRRLSVLQQALESGQRQGWPAGQLSPLRLQLAAEFQDALPARATALLEDVLREDPGTSAAGEALAALVRAAIDVGDFDTAAARIQKHGPAAAGTAGWRDALWALFAAAYSPPGTRDKRPGDLAAARRALDALAAGATRDPAVLYWQARLAWESEPRDAGAKPDGNSARVAALIRDLTASQPLSYYSVLAHERWPDLAPAPVPRPVSGAPVPAAESSGGPEESAVPSGILALKSQGLAREAAQELLYLANGRSNSENAGPPGEARFPGLLFTLARWQLELGEFRAAGRTLNRLFGEQPGALVGPDARRQALAGLFPTPYEAAARAEAAARGLDPLIVLAVMREESSFEPLALSPSSAYGLMQIIEPTARWLAGREGMAIPDPAALYDPSLNIRLGTAYLRYLLDRYGELRVAAAAYHAGPGRVDRWLQAFGTTDAELFVERIPVAATRRYVQNVYRSYRVYQQLHGSGR